MSRAGSAEPADNAPENGTQIYADDAQGPRVFEDFIIDMKNNYSKAIDSLEDILRDEYSKFQQKLLAEKQAFDHYKQKMREMNRIQQSKVDLNVGGTRYTVSLQTLCKESDSMLSAMFGGHFCTTPDKDGSIFIDRDGSHFAMVLTYLRDGIIDPRAANDPIMREYLEREAHFFQLQGLIQLLNGGSEASDNESIMCDLSVEPKITVLEGHEQAVKCLQFKDDILVTGAYDRTLKVWSLSKGQCIRTIVTEAVWCLQFCGTRHLITGHGDNLIRVWDTTSWQCVRMLHGHTATVMCLQCEGNLLCSGSWDDTLKLWNVDSGEPTKTFSGHTKAIWCLQFREGMLVSGSEDKTIRVWDMRSGLCLKVLQGHSGIVRCVSLFGDILYSGGDDKTIKEWDLNEGICMRTLHNHAKTVRCLQIRDKVMVSGSYDNSIKIWDSSYGRCIRTLTGHVGYITSVQFKDSTLVTGSEDKTIRIWTFRR